MTHQASGADTNGDSEFLAMRRTNAFGGLLELLESAPPGSAVQTEGIAALLSVILESD